MRIDSLVFFGDDMSGSGFFALKKADIDRSAGSDLAGESTWPPRRSAKNRASEKTGSRADPGRKSVGSTNNQSKCDAPAALVVMARFDLWLLLKMPTLTGFS